MRDSKSNKKIRQKLRSKGRRSTKYNTTHSNNKVTAGVMFNQYFYYITRTDKDKHKNDNKSMF